MLKIINKISLALFLAATPFLFYGFGAAILQIISKASFGNPRWLWFLAGAAIFFPCLFAAKRLFHSGWCYLQTLEHELTHLLIGLLFLKIPTGIRVSAHEGGEVRQIGFGTTGQIWVTLAPYFFPTISIAVLIPAYFTGLNTLPLLGVLGWTTAFHLVTNWSETSFRQPDLQKAGILKTILILPIMNLICYGAVLAFVADGSKGFGNFWQSGFREAFHLAVKIW
ncbi:MAG: hypothetical protein LH614_19430 [Pyrinomonadaceae bacterium]|nr:hypothetical protein [Pyrinomonadaceae bacterium]